MARSDSCLHERVKSFGVDLSSTAFHFSKPNCFEISPCFYFPPMPLGNLPFKNDYFDTVFSLGAAYHMIDYEAYIRELSRVTKKGGTVFVTDFANKLHPVNIEGILLSKIYSLLFRKDWPSTFKSVTLNDIKQSFKRSGLKIEKIYARTYPYLPLINYTPARFREICSKFGSRQTTRFQNCSPDFSLLATKI